MTDWAFEIQESKHDVPLLFWTTQLKFSFLNIIKTYPSICCNKVEDM